MPSSDRDKANTVAEPPPKDIKWTLGFDFCPDHYGVLASAFKNAKDFLDENYPQMIDLDTLPEDISPIDFVKIDSSDDPKFGSQEFFRSLRIQAWLIEAFLVLAPDVEDIWEHLRATEEKFWDERDSRQHTILRFGKPVLSPPHKKPGWEVAKDNWPGKLPHPDSKEFDALSLLFGKPNWYPLYEDAVLAGLCIPPESGLEGSYACKQA